MGAVMIPRVRDCVRTIRPVRVLALLVFGGFFLSPGYGFQGTEELEPKEKTEKELRAVARAKISEFKDGFKKARTEDERVDLIRTMAECKHGDIAKVMVGLLKTSWIRVRREVAEQLGAYTGDARLSDLLLRHGCAEKEEAVVLAILDSVGNISACRGVSRLPQFYERKIPISQKAIEISGKIKSRDIVQPLIKFLEKMERIHPVVGLVPVKTGIVHEPDMDRKEALLPSCQKALIAILGEDLSNSKAYQEWWNMNMAAFRDPEELEREEKKRQEQEKGTFRSR